MKKQFYIFILSLVFAGGTFNASAQALSKGNFVIDPYYGFPNFGKAFAESLAQGSESSVDVGGIGPWGIRMEYLLGDQFGLTLDGIHNSFSFSETYTPDYITLSNGNQVPNNTPYDYKASMNRLRIQVGFNYHFQFTGPNLDYYVGVGAGTNTRFYNFTTNEPNSDFEEDNQSEVSTLIPVSFRLRTGARYYFTDNFGLNMEIGLGGPVLSGGLSIKL